MGLPFCNTRPRDIARYVCRYAGGTAARSNGWLTNNGVIFIFSGRLACRVNSAPRGRRSANSARRNARMVCRFNCDNDV